MISILYVDDEPGLLELCRIFLEQTGEFRVDTVESADGALARIDGNNYDAIISDYQMPGRSGIDLLKSIREQRKDLPFLLLTGKGREEIVIEALNNGADFYIQKGGDPKAQFAELMHKIRQAVEKRRAEHGLRESEKRLIDIIDFLPDATFAIDKEGKVIAWNRAIEELTGVPAADMLGKGDYEYAIPLYGHRRPVLIDLIFEPEDRIRTHYSGILHEKDMLIAESDLPLPQGRKLTITGKASPLYNQKGELTGAIESIRDITARKLAEDELRAAYEEIQSTEEELRQQYDAIAKNEHALKDSEEKYRTLVENNQDIIYIQQGDRILAINRRGPEVLGYSGEELMRMQIWDLLHPDDRQRVIERNRARIGGHEISTQYTARVVTKAGRVIPMELIAAMITYRGDRAIMGIARDMTRQEELIGSLEQKTRTLTIINRIIQTASRKSSVGEIAYTALSSICGILGFDCGGIYLIDYDARRARIISSLNMSDELIRETDDIPIDGEHYKSVFIGNTALVSENYQEINPERSSRYGILSIASIPLVTEDHVIGALNVASRQRREIPQDMTDALVAIGKELGGAVTRIRTEEALQKSESRYGTLADAAQDLIYIIDRDDTVVYVNASAAAHIGRDRREIIGMPRNKIFKEGESERQLKNIRKVFSTGLPLQTESRIPMPAGDTWQNTHLIPLRDADGTIAGVMGVSRDVTAMKRAEDAARASESKYRSIIENLPDMFYRTDMDGKILMISPAGARMAGYDSAEDMIGLDIASTLYAEPPERKKFLSTLARNGAVTAYPLSFRDRSGRRFHVSASSHYFRDESGKIIGIEGIVHDISYIRQTEEALREANRKLNLLNNITRHDVVNQITVLTGYIQLARIKNSDPVIGDFLAKIDTVSATIARQVEFSRTYQELGEHAPDWFTLDDVLKRTKPRDILFSTSCTGIEIYADPMLEKVFANLFGNSVMHGEQVTRIAVTCGQAGEDLVIAVEDNGIGIPLDQKQKIFRKGFGKNTGFGLFLAREILAITGIMIHETGVHGKGARFEITIPKQGYRPARRS